MSKKLVLVTGGNNGIGLETCSQLAAQPDTHVLMASRSLEKGQKALEGLKSKAPESSIEVIQLDITSDASIDAAVKTVTEKHGHLDTLINNAGVCPTELSRDLLRETFDTNAISPALVTRAFAPLLRKSSSPRVVYVSSSLGSLTMRADPKNFAYDGDWKVYRMSKAALDMLALCDAWEYEKDGFRIFTFCPGYVVSDLAGMREAKQSQGVQGPEKSGKALVAVHQGQQDENAGKFISAASVVDGAPLYPF